MRRCVATYSLSFRLRLIAFCIIFQFLLTSQVLTPTLARLGTHRGVSEFELKPMDFASATAVFRALCERRSPKEVFYNSLCAPLPRSPLNPLPPILGGSPARMVYLIQRGLPHVQSSAQEIRAARDRGVTALTVSAVRERSTARPVWAPDAAQSAVQSRLRWGLQSAIEGLLESERVLRECGLPGPPPVKSANLVHWLTVLYLSLLVILPLLIDLPIRHLFIFPIRMCLRNSTSSCLVRHRLGAFYGSTRTRPAVASPWSSVCSRFDSACPTHL
jgi:hypothetical protein